VTTKSFRKERSVEMVKNIFLVYSFIFSIAIHAQTPTVNAICSTDQSWCEMAASEFQKAMGMRVLQTHKPTGEALAQLRAEASNPKTDIWWGGTGDPFLQAAEIGLLESYRPAYINDLHSWSVRQYEITQNMVGRVLYQWNWFWLQHRSIKKEKITGAAALVRHDQTDLQR